MKTDSSKVALQWIRVLNDQTEWTSLRDASLWFEQLLERPVAPAESALADFWQTLNVMRSVIYDIHFGRTPSFDAVNKRLDGVSFAFHGEGNSARLPAFRARAVTNDDSAILGSLVSTLLFEFGHDISQHLLSCADFDIARCAGLYRDPKLNRLSAAPDVSDEVELAWRREIDVLLEQNLQESNDILRCADLFVPTSRSRFCSNACRTNTFQIVKQLQDPVYLAEKQRRYRATKTK